MKSKIHSVTIVNQQGSHCYAVGQSYNNLELARIEDKSIEFPDGTEFVYMGFTDDDALVFEAINLPMDIDYEPKHPDKGGE